MRTSLSVLCALVAAAAPWSAGAGEPEQSTISVDMFRESVTWRVPEQFAAAAGNTDAKSRLTSTSKWARYEASASWQPAANWGSWLGIDAVKDGAKMQPSTYIDKFATEYKKDCPTTFSGRTISQMPISGMQAHAAVFACGASLAAKGGASQTTMVIAVRGQFEMFAFRWVERSTPADAPLELSWLRWRSRLRNTSEIRLCAVHLGAPEFPGCAATRPDLPPEDDRADGEKVGALK